MMLSFLSRGRLRDTAGGGGSPEVASCRCTGGQPSDTQPPTQNTQSFNDLEVSTWPGDNLLAALSTSEPASPAAACAPGPTPSALLHHWLLLACSPPALQKVASYEPRECRPAPAWASQHTSLLPSGLNYTFSKEV